MKLCLITNYKERGYVNETFIFNKLKETLNISSIDVFNTHEITKVYNLNRQYTHSIIFLDYYGNSIKGYIDFLSEVKIPKIFIIDTVPEMNRELDSIFVKELLQTGISNLTILPKDLQNLLYNKFADGLIFLTPSDINLFFQKYKLDNTIPYEVIPPSLGNKEDIKIDFNNLIPNNNIGFNGVPSFKQGLYSIFTTLYTYPKYFLNVYGGHGRNDLSNELLVNHIVGNSTFIKYKGKLKNESHFFQENHIFFNICLYDSFNYPTFKSLLNGMIPIISNASGTSAYFPDYPFICEHSTESIINTLDKITQTSKHDLKNIMEAVVSKLTELNNDALKEKYVKFLKQF